MNRVIRQPDMVHNHLDFGYRPPDQCPACDQTRIDKLLIRVAAKKAKKALAQSSAPE